MIDALRRAAGSGAVEAPAPAGWTVHARAAHALVSPDSADAVAAVLALCSSEGWSVEPAGAGTWLDHGRAPETAADVILSTRRLGTRIASEPADLVADVDPGVPLDALRDRLRTDRQELALDPPHAAGSTLGATISLAAAGPLRASAATPRDHVLGLVVATGDGRLIRFGGRVVKNVAGYDVVRLLTGSRGTLGVITGLWLRLRALPAGDRSWVVTGDASQLVQLVAGLATVQPAAAELLAPRTAARLGLPPAWALVLRLRGGPEELADALRRLRGLVAGLALDEVDTAFWQALDRAETAARPVIRVAGLPARLGPTLAHCEAFISASGNEIGEWQLAAHATDGIVRLWPGQDPGDTVAEALIDLRAAAEADGGSVLLEGAGPALQARVPIRGAVDEVTRRLERELKRVMDPAGILAPGRWT